MHRAGPVRTRRRLAVAAVALVVAALAGLGVGWLSDDDSIDVVTDEDPQEPVGFQGWEPGWHEIDPGPVPASSGVSMAWFDDRLVVAGGTFVRDPSAPTWSGGVWAYDPPERSWTRLPSPPFDTLSLAAADGHLVAVGGPADRLRDGTDRPVAWATWQPGDDAWAAHGDVPIAPELTAVGMLGPAGPNGTGAQLVWTGERVLDVTHGSAMDPSTGAAGAMAMPDDLIGFAHLSRATAVPAAGEVILSSWSSQSGLAWSATGESYREIPGPPVTQQDLAGVADATPNDGQAVLVAREEIGAPGLETVGRAAAFDPGGGGWAELPGVPAPTEPWCPYTAASAGDRVIAQGCQYDAALDESVPTDLFVLGSSEWTSIGRPPRPEHGIEQWLGTDDALMIWSGDDDTSNNPDAPYRWAAVWIPEPGTPIEDRPATTAPTTGAPTTGVPATNAPGGAQADCAVDQLPDLGPILPTSLDIGPTPGIGGMPSSEDLCARHWGSSTDPARHLTQQPGRSVFSIASPSASGPYVWGRIEDGWAIERRTAPEWSVLLSGVSRAELDSIVLGLLADTTSFGPVDRSAAIELEGLGIAGNLSTLEEVEVLTAPGGADVLELRYGTSLPDQVRVSQGGEPASGECVAPEGMDGAVFLNVTTKLNELAPGLAGDGSGSALPDSSGPGGPVGRARTTCHLESQTSLSATLAGPTSMTVEVDDESGTVRIVLG